MNHPLIIGAGGVASYLLPVLIKTFRPRSITLVDKDTLEKRNLDRQLFKPHQVGMNKAAALQKLYEPDWLANDPERGCVFGVIDAWFDTDTPLLAEPYPVDAIFCCADNHATRHQAMLKAHELHCYAYVGGNELIDSQAFVYHPDWKDTGRDILRRYPNIATDETGSPFRCQGDAQEIFPQLAVANLSCAAKLLHLAYLYEVWLPLQQLPSVARAEIMPYLPVEFHSTLTTNTSET